MKHHRFVPLFSIVSLAVVMAAGQPTANVRAASAAPSLIVVGVSMGPVKLGPLPSGGVKGLMTALGNGAAADKSKTQVSLKEPAGGKLLVRVYAGQVVGIETTSPAFATKSGKTGIHVGSPASDVKAIKGIKFNGSSFYLVGTTVIAASVANPVHTYFDLDKTNAKVESIRVGYFPWLTPCFDGPTDMTSQSEIVKSQEWTTRGCPYQLDYGDFYVESKATVTVDPGVIVGLAGGQPGGDGVASLDVSGKLVANGTVDQPTYFTSEYDQARGAIPSSGLAPCPQGKVCAHAGDWSALGVLDGGSISLNNAIVAYGGGSKSSHNAALVISDEGKNSRLAITYTLIADNSLYGIDAQYADASTVIKNTVFSGNHRPLLAGPGLTLDNSLNFTPKNMSPNTQPGVFLPGMDVQSGPPLTLSLTAVPFVMTDNITVEGNTQLTIGPGVMLKAAKTAEDVSPVYLSIAGNASLQVNGTLQKPVVMTSFQDDAVKGDTNGDGSASKAAPGDWIGLQVSDHAKLSADCLDVRYAGADSGGNKAALNLNTDGGVTIANSEIARSLGDGLLIGQDTHPVSLVKTSIHDNAGFGIDYASSDSQASATVTGVTYTNNTAGEIGVAGSPVPTPTATG